CRSRTDQRHHRYLSLVLKTRRITGSHALPFIPGPWQRPFAALRSPATPLAALARSSARGRRSPVVSRLETRNPKQLLDAPHRCLGELLLREIPLLHVESVGRGDSFRGVFLGLRSGNNHRLARLPVCRSSTGVGVGGLQRFEDAQDLVDVAA